METPKNTDFPSLVRAHLQEQELPVKSDSPSLSVSPKDIFFVVCMICYLKIYWKYILRVDTIWNLATDQ